MRSLLLSVVIISFISFNMMAQPSSDGAPPVKRPFKDRLVFGGTLGAQFGTSTQVNISPIIGYRVTEKLTAGIGITYIYYKYKYYTGSATGNQTYTESDNIYGGSLWAQYRVIPQAFLQVEPGFLNLSIPSIDPGGIYSGKTVRYNAYTFLVGGGYYQALGPNAGMQFTLLWDLVEDTYSPYSNPIIRIGFAAGF